MNKSLSRDMTSGNPVRHIISFAVPIVIGGMFQQLYNLVDTALVGRFIGSEALAAVGSTSFIFMLLLSFIMGLANGSGIIIAQYFGSGDYKGLQAVLLSMALIVGSLTIILSAGGFFFSGALLHLLDTPQEIFDTAHGYIRLLISFCFTTMLYNASSTVLRSVGNSRLPLYALIIASFCNIGLDLLFIIRFGMGVRGAALATVISQGLSSLICLVYMYRHRHALHLLIPFMRPVRGDLIKILQAGLPASLQSSFIAVGNMSVQRLVNGFGTSVMAAYAASSKIDMFSLTIILGITNSLSVFSSQNIGAGKIDRVVLGLRQTLFFMLSLCVVLAALIYTFKAQLLALFIDPRKNPVATEIGIAYLSIIGVAYIMAGIMRCYLSLIRGAGDVNISFLAGIVELSSRVILSYLFVAPLGFLGIIIAIPLSWGMGSVVPVLRYYSGRWKERSFVTAGVYT